MPTNPLIINSGAGASVGWNGTTPSGTSINSLIKAFTQTAGAAFTTSGSNARFDTDYTNPFSADMANAFSASGT